MVLAPFSFFSGPCLLASLADPIYPQSQIPLSSGPPPPPVLSTRIVPARRRVLCFMCYFSLLNYFERIWPLIPRGSFAISAGCVVFVEIWNFGMPAGGPIRRKWTVKWGCSEVPCRAQTSARWGRGFIGNDITLCCPLCTPVHFALGMRLRILRCVFYEHKAI